jgi:hypothetical protein
LGWIRRKRHAIPEVRENPTIKGLLQLRTFFAGSFFRAAGRIVRISKLFIAQTSSVSLQFTSSGLYKIHSSTDGTRRLCSTTFYPSSLHRSFTYSAFFATRRTVDCHFQFGMMDKTLFFAGMYGF